MSQEYSFGPSFKAPWFYVGMALIIASVIPFFNYDFTPGLLLLVVSFGLGVFLMLYIRGVQIDMASGKQREYFVLFFTKFGKWKDINGYNLVGIFRSDMEGDQIVKKSGAYQVTTWDVYLLKDKTSRALICEFEKFDEAKEFAKDFAKKYNKKVLDYSKLIKHLMKKDKPSKDT